MRSARPCLASAPSARTWWSPVARSWRRSWRFGRRRTSASPTAAYAKESCARSWRGMGGCFDYPPSLEERGRGTAEGGGGGDAASPLHHAVFAAWSPSPGAPLRRRILKRLRTAKGRKVSSTRWLERQLNDPYVRRAKAENYRSRAAYKLLELDERFGFLKGAKSVVDLGIAPGGWSQVVRRKAPEARVVGIDLLPTDPIDGVTILQLDFMDDAAPARLKAELGSPADLVLSDMAANTVGHQQTDHLR